jgi:hypothetical protein
MDPQRSEDIHHSPPSELGNQTLRRSGMSPELFEDYIPEIKVACFAKEVTFYRHHRWAHLLTIELRRA